MAYLLVHFLVRLINYQLLPHTQAILPLCINTLFTYTPSTSRASNVKLPIEIG